MFDNLQFLNDLYSYCVAHNINYCDLTYTEQLAVIRSMLVAIARNHNKSCKYNSRVYIKKRRI